MAVRHKGTALVVLALAAFTAGCLDLTEGEPLEVIIWEGTLEPLPVPDAPTPITGNMSMLADQTFTVMGVGVQGGEPDGRLGWEIRQGSCGAAGDLVGSPDVYPEFGLDELGMGEMQTVLNRRVADAPVYAGKVLSDADSGSQLLACADLIRRQ